MSKPVYEITATTAFVPCKTATTTTKRTIVFHETKQLSREKNIKKNEQKGFDIQYTDPPPPRAEPKKKKTAFRLLLLQPPAKTKTRSAFRCHFFFYVCFFKNTLKKENENKERCTSHVSEKKQKNEAPPTANTTKNYNW